MHARHTIFSLLCLSSIAALTAYAQAQDMNAPPPPAAAAMNVPPPAVAGMNVPPSVAAAPAPVAAPAAAPAVAAPVPVVSVPAAPVAAPAVPPAAAPHPAPAAAPAVAAPAPPPPAKPMMTVPKADYDAMRAAVTLAAATSSSTPEEPEMLAMANRFAPLIALLLLPLILMVKYRSEQRAANLLLSEYSIRDELDELLVEVRGSLARLEAHAGVAQHQHTDHGSPSLTI